MKVDTDTKKIEHLLNYQVEEVIVREELEKRLLAGKPLRIKLGADPSRPDLHLGHAVVLRKLREFQDLGHQVVFIIGDFTALIGDPSGKSKTRPMISAAEIKKNAKTYFQQVGRILDLKKCEVRYNSEWLGKMGTAEVIGLMAKFTVARILERDDFTKRMSTHTDVYMHELLYPMLQAQDSIDLKADVEIGGTDQKFNMLAGRDLARRQALPEQCVMTCPIMVGTDGVNKMSKSLDNYIGLDDSADEMYGKTMSIPDAALPNWLALAADLSEEEIVAENAKLKAGENPRDVKARLAERIVALYHDPKAAQSAAANFVARFKKGEMPAEMPTLKAAGQKLADVVAQAFAVSKTEARRLIESGGVKIDGVVAKDALAVVKSGAVVQKGKLGFAKIS